MLTRHLSRSLFTRFTVGSTRLAAFPVHGVSTLVNCIPSRRYLITDADLSPMEGLSEARQKLRQALLDYRNNHFGQTLFSRFIKEMIVVTDANQDGKISIEEMKNMLKNIGCETLITDEDLEAVFEEIGHKEDGEPLIYTDEIEMILTGR